MHLYLEDFTDVFLITTLMINHTVLGIRVKKGKGSPRKMPFKDDVT